MFMGFLDKLNEGSLTCPAVMAICHTQAPNTVGLKATKIGEAAIIQRPGNITRKSSSELVKACAIGGKIKQPNI